MPASEQALGCRKLSLVWDLKHGRNVRRKTVFLQTVSCKE